MTEIAKHADTLPTREVLRDFLEWCDGQKIELALPGTSGTRYMPLIEDRERLLDRYLDAAPPRVEGQTTQLRDEPGNPEPGVADAASPDIYDAEKR